MNIKQIVKKLVGFSPRQGKNLILASRFIIDFISKNKITHKLQYMKAKTPLTLKAELFVDGKKIKCEGCSFVGGKINGKEAITSSQISSRYLIDVSNINFNPSGKAICRNNFYFAPAVAIDKKDVSTIFKAKRVLGEVKIKVVSTRVPHILAGNFKNPKNIVFAHYDSIGSGSIDNASGVAVSLATLVKYPEILKQTLFVFDGNEELSYDYPTYWGHGFRVFEKRNFRIMDECKKIVPLDSVGNGKTFVSRDPKLIRLAFPITNIERWNKKISTLCGDVEDLMTVYHSDADKPSKLKEEYLQDALRVLVMELE